MKWGAKFSKLVAVLPRFCPFSPWTPQRFHGPSSLLWSVLPELEGSSYENLEMVQWAGEQEESLMAAGLFLNFGHHQVPSLFRCPDFQVPAGKSLLKGCLFPAGLLCINPLQIAEKMGTRLTDNHEMTVLWKKLQLTLASLLLPTPHPQMFYKHNVTVFTNEDAEGK